MQWEIKKNLNTARSHPAVVSVDGKIYAIGGGGPNFKSLSSVECYNPRFDCWDHISDMPTKRSGTAAVVNGNRIYVIGGGYKKTDGNFCFLPTLEIYDIKKNKWETGPDMNQTHDYPAVAFLSGEIYLMSGHHPDATEGGPKTDPGSSFCEKWKLGSDSWQELESLSVPRFAASAQVVNKEIWVMGGVAFTGSGFNNYDIIEIYSPEKNQWRKEDAISLPWPAAALSSVFYEDKLYVMGGYCGNSIHARITSTTCGDGNLKWDDLSALPESRAAMGAVVCDGKLYTVGGWAEDGRTPVDSVYSLQL